MHDIIPSFIDIRVSKTLVWVKGRGHGVRPTKTASRVRNSSKLLSDLGLSQHRLYDFLHTYATLLLAAGEHPKVVAESLDPSNIAITLNPYIHVFLSEQEKAISKIAAVFD